MLSVILSITLTAALIALLRSNRKRTKAEKKIQKARIAAESLAKAAMNLRNDLY